MLGVVGSMRKAVRWRMRWISGMSQGSSMFTHVEVRGIPDCGWLYIMTTRSKRFNGFATMLSTSEPFGFMNFSNNDS
jgi:hypothetical protein